MSNAIKGHCHCGSITVEVPADSFGIIACHCSDCQKLHGNFFAMLAVDRDNVQWDGSTARTLHTTSEHVERSFCPVCGSRIAKEPKSGTKILISVGLFQSDLPRSICRQVFTESKPAWYDLPATVVTD